MPKKHIMVVDDNPNNLLLILRVLEEPYRVSCIESAKDCLKALSKDTPDLILMDVCMPEMNGYQCCQHIKQEPQFSHIPVLFLSGQTQIEDKLKGYEAGGADYLTKPCDIKEVLAKIEQNLSLVEQFQSKLNEANNAASMAINQNGELGMRLQFLEDSFKCQTQEALADLILNTLQAYKFNACVQLRGKQKTLDLNLSGHSLPLETSLMTEVIGQGDFLEFGHRVLCSTRNISMLIKNLPQENEGLCQRLKEHISSILNGASARMENLNTVNDNEEKLLSQIIQAIEKIEKNLIDIEQVTDHKNQGMAEILERLNNKVHDSFSQLDLSSQQRSYLLQLLTDSMDEVFNLACEDELLKYQFSEITEQLAGITHTKIH